MNYSRRYLLLKLIALALHFGPYSNGSFDPMVVEMLRHELSSGVDDSLAETNVNDNVQTSTGKVVKLAPMEERAPTRKVA